ncbi:MAG: SMC-Scp complex subunit ScpB [Candidatus Pacebacteria bacterium]|nr:SMC-Scp complex subunit ScpB [Candidatus Paceibacterota bacterium]
MNIESAVESLLFISGEPMNFKKLAKIIAVKESDIKLSAEKLSAEYSDSDRGLKIIIKDNRVQMVTSGENSLFVEKYLKADIEGELSRAALEVISIVSYRGPISRSEIEDIRGVNCSFTLRHLAIRGLVERINNPNDARAYLYQVSFDFLKKLGVEKVEDLPKYNELREKKMFERNDENITKDDASVKENSDEDKKEELER